MRISLLAALLLTACAPRATTPPGPPPGTYHGAGKDRLIVAGTAESPTADLLVFAPDGAANCSMAGTVARAGGEWQLTPPGEGDCHVALTIDGKVARITNVPAACSYYCGPGAGLERKSFARER